MYVVFEGNSPRYLALEFGDRKAVPTRHDITLVVLARMRSDNYDNSKLYTDTLLHWESRVSFV